MKTVQLIALIAATVTLQGCMSLGGTFSKPEKGYAYSSTETEPNGCNKVFIGTRVNVYLLNEHPHAYQIAYYDIVPSLVADIVLLPISLPYTAYIQAASICLENGA